MEKMRKKAGKESEIVKALKRLKAIFGSVFAFTTFMNLLLLVSPLYMMQVYDRVLGSRSESTLMVLTVMAIALMALYGALEWLRSQILVRVGILFDDALSKRIFDAIFTHSLRLPKAGLHSAQMHSAQPLRDLDSVRQFATGQGVLAFIDAPWMPIFLGALFLLHPIYGAYALIAGLVLFGLAALQEIGVRKEIVAATNYTIQAHRFVDINLRNSEVVEAMGMRPKMEALWRNRHQKTLNLQAIASDWAGVVSALTKFWQSGTQIGILGVGAYLVLENQVTGGAMIAASVLMGRALAPVTLAVGTWPQLVNARFAYARLSALLENVPVEPPRMELPSPVGNLQVEQLVVFPPGSQVPAVRGVGFTVAQGEMVGLIGPSAAGKSTLVRALLGVWPVAQGTVRLDGADISQWDRAALGKFVGYLPQDVELFDGTVAANIARMGDVDSGAVVDAAKLAGVHELILRLPQGYDTLLGDGGQTLSGGQRQRIGLARALYGSPPLVILDEPNSNLDQAGEAALAQTVAHLKKLRQTLIIVTHRPHILTFLDKIIVLNAGVVDRIGPAAEILAAYTRPVSVPAAAAHSAGG